MENNSKEPEEENFPIRMYRKQELAMLYFPDCSKEAASKNLRRWIKRCTPLTEELNKNGYHKQHNFFLKHEVALIVAYLGEPY